MKYNKRSWHWRRLSCGRARVGVLARRLSGRITRSRHRLSMATSTRPRSSPASFLTARPSLIWSRPARPRMSRPPTDDRRKFPGLRPCKLRQRIFSGPTPPGRPSIRLGSTSTCSTTSRACGRCCSKQRHRCRPTRPCCRYPTPTSCPAAGSAKSTTGTPTSPCSGWRRIGQHDAAVGMLENFAYVIDRYGHIPNGNRSYYLSRSQPPFFALMVDLLAQRDWRRTYGPLPAGTAGGIRLLDAAAKTRSCPAMPAATWCACSDGDRLNRYWDERAPPRDESYARRCEAANADRPPPAQFYQNLRAAADSGWDFSSRWFGRWQRAYHPYD